MTATTSQLAYSLPVSRTAVPRRRISPEAGRALEKLGHAIEYLSDRFMVSGDPFSRDQLEAILLLMEINREVYGECPEVPSLSQRFAAWLGSIARA